MPKNEAFKGVFVIHLRINPPLLSALGRSSIAAGNMTTKAKDLMRPAVLVNENDTLKTVLKKMVTEKRNSLTVVNSAGELVGAVNAIDIIKAVVPDYLEDDQTAAKFASEAILKEDAERASILLVKDFMATEIPTIDEETGLVEAMSIAVRAGRGRITVVDKANHPVGVLTRTELKRIISSYLGIVDDK